MLYHEKTLRTVANNTRADGEEFLWLAAAISIRPETTEFPPAEANEALSALKTGQTSGAAVLRI